MTQAIKVEVRSVYGVPTIYPVCDRAKSFADLAKKKTLNHSDLKIIKSLGFQIEEVVAQKLVLA